MTTATQIHTPNTSDLWSKVATGAVFLTLAFIPAVIAGTWGSTQTAWYTALDKPSFQPPGWLFGPVWTVLYTLIGIAGWRLWRASKSKARTQGLTLWGIQLVLNAAWSPLFFGAQSPTIALVCIVLMWLSIATSIAIFRRVDTLSSWLFVPYLMWVSFATVLNATFVAMGA